MTEILGYFCALIIGVTLGLIGGGGSILTVPVLVYIFGIDPVLATAYSLFVVGVSSLFGVWKNTQKNLINYKVAFAFAIPSFLAVFLTRRFLVPAIPDVVYQNEHVFITKPVAIMVLFALIMFMAAWSMIRKEKESKDKEKLSLNTRVIVADGVIVGVLTGVVGAGGGFLIIPVLVIVVGLPMKVAVGTSLLIIAAKSLIGFLGDLGASQQIDWVFLSIFTILAIIGIFIGTNLSNFIPSEKLKKGFGWFVLIMAIYILIKELIL